MSLISRSGLILSKNTYDTFSSTWGNRVPGGFLESIASNAIDVTSTFGPVRITSDLSNVVIGAQTVSNVVVVGSNSVVFNVPIETTFAIGDISVISNVLYVTSEGASSSITSAGIAIGDTSRMLQWNANEAGERTAAWRVLGGALQLNNPDSNLSYNLHINASDELQLYVIEDQLGAAKTPSPIMVFSKVPGALVLPTSPNKYM